MLPLDDPRWTELRHAYGAASGTPGLLKRAALDAGPGHDPKSAWFELWSALCHQGDIYTASYAALPHLIAIAHARPHRGQYDPILLAGSIELARLEGMGPAILDYLTQSYFVAVAEGKLLAEEALEHTWDDDSKVAFEGSLAALTGKADVARAIFDAD